MQKKLEDNYTLGYTDHRSNDYKQACFEYGGFSEIRGFFINGSPTEKEFEFMLAIPEEEVMNDDGSYKAEAVQKLKDFARILWVMPQIRTIQTGTEQTEGITPENEIMTGVKPATDGFRSLVPFLTEQLTARMAPTNLEKRLRADGSYEELPTAPCNDFNYTALTPMTPETIFANPETRAIPRISHMGRKDGMKLQDVADGKMTLEAFAAALPDEDLAALLGGQPNVGLANTYGYGNNPVYGIPNIMTADGPAGIRFHEGLGVTTTAFPCATLLAATWDPELCGEVGSAAAREAKENNIMVWLAPGVNIHRNPLCGRNFEYYSEDPLLAGKQAAGLVRGVQAEHIAATPKHFALNNKETNRRNCDARVSERAIREIYLRQFEIVVKESHPWSLMSSYNIVNGHRASENKDLLTGILREEWGFDGMVTTDWWTLGEHYKEAAAGNDMKMATGFPERLLEALEKGVLTREEMEKAAVNILRLILRID